MLETLDILIILGIAIIVVVTVYISLSKKCTSTEYMETAACSATDPTCWRYQNLNKLCQNCKCKYEISSDKQSLNATLRKLFTDHANYTHLFIISAVFDLPNLDAVTQRLLQNQTDIGMAVQSTYDVEKGKQLEILLKQHILVAAEVVKGAKVSSPNLNQSVAKLFDNSTLVAQLLSSLAPDRLPLEEVLKHFDGHNQYVIDLTKLYLAKKYAEALNLFDCYYAHMLHFADMLTLS